ncbi:MAG TPA: anhydro-N-acetylmuramic acid kinase [Tepidisphaeraceae bacterium]|jgi:anhydro-N-acetylmuramic acid kinase
MDPRLIVGTMSGTSADGVDAAITRITGRGTEMAAQLVSHHYHPYPNDLRQEIFAFRNDQVKQDVLGRLARMSRGITLATAAAVNDALTKAKLQPSQITAVAAHGQTLFHDPPITIQWFDPSLLAHETNCTVVSDFRRADLAAGGQGAPLVPFADYILFRHPTKNRVLLNLGGIANITWLPAGCTTEQVLAFDTGPANCISDWICRTRGPLDMSWDVDGQGASRGRVVHEVVDHFLQDGYVAIIGPKSTDGPAMIAAFERALASSKHAPTELNDLLATAAYLTARTIVDSIHAVTKRVDEVIASGGGTHNKAIMNWLASKLTPTPVKLTEDAGVSGPAKEALAFALLAAATLDNLPSNIPSVTGAARSLILGSITPQTP